VTDREPIEIESSSVLLVEGWDDVGFLQSFLAHHERTAIQVLPYLGRDRLRTYLLALRNTRGFENVRWLGVCQDADANADAAMQRIRDVLQNAGSPRPDHSWETAQGIPEVVAFVMPNGADPGDLESLLWNSVEDRRLSQCVLDFLGCVEQIEGTVPQPVSKARAYAYMAVSDPPAWRLSSAMRDRIFDFDHRVFQPLLDLLPRQVE
jgi:hypothetical protein